jgi:hypothetical protein
VKLFLQFALGSFPLALPTTDLHIEPISPKTYLDEGLDGGDHLAMEAPTLLRKFAVGAHPTLSNARRLKSGLMTTVGAPWNALGVAGSLPYPWDIDPAEAAWPGLLGETPTAAPAPEPYMQVPSRWD